MNRNRWAPVVAAATAMAVLAVVVGVSALSRKEGTAGPPVLRLAGVGASYAAAADGARGSYRLIGTLPNGPSEARVRDLPATAAPVDRVRALAAALGQVAEPVRVKGAWKAGDLRVSDEPGNPWTWGQTSCPDTPVSSDGGVVKDLAASICTDGTISSGGGSASSGTAHACPAAPPGAEPIACDDVPGILPPVRLPPEKALLTESQALTATARIREALGLTQAPTRVEGFSVVVEPLAGGLRTTGLGTFLQLSSQARVVGANGWMSTGREGDLYPLRTARAAFDDMPVFAIGAPCDAAGCPEGPAITGARLGLSRVELDGGSAALVPAWLFTVKDSPVPLVALAVADRFLGGPDPAKTEPPSKPGATEPGTEPTIKPTSEPGVIEPDLGGSVSPSPLPPPTPPSPATAKPVAPKDRAAFAFDGAYADADPKVLVVRYGDSGSCPSQAVRHDVVEQPDRVVVTLTRTPMPADQACTMGYQAKLIRVTLTAPLGSREVVDGSRKEPVPISTGTPPFG